MSRRLSAADITPRETCGHGTIYPVADFRVRRARTTDVPTIGRLVSGYADERILLHKETVTYYEDVQEFRVAVDADDRVIGCGAIHVLWEDLAEVRTLAVASDARGAGWGTRCWTP